MTIATRNRFFKLAIAVSALLSAAAIGIAVTALTGGRLPAEIPGVRVLSPPRGLPFSQWSPAASLIHLAAFPFFSLIWLIYIYRGFEKTQSSEMIFFAASVFAVSFEMLRIVIPLTGVDGGYLITVISRVSLFSRIFFLLSILSSGLFNSAQTAQMIGSSIFLLGFISFSLSQSIPINSMGPTSNFILLTGYPAILSLFFVCIGALAILSYLILGITRATKEYFSYAGGLALLIPGYFLLILADNWLYAIGGAALLNFGTWLYMDRMHRYYLWQ